jgi:hypothetical protein
MFNIALNTAVAIMKAASSAPPPANVPLIVLTAALGAIQLGLAAAQPIPKYAKGGKTESGIGIFGEAGRELMMLRSGELAIANKSTYFEGSKFKGAEIFSNPVTEKLLAGEGFGDNRQMTDERILTGLDSVRKAILSKPVAVLDKDYRQIGHTTSAHQTIYLNKLTYKN